MSALGKCLSFGGFAIDRIAVYLLYLNEELYILAITWRLSPADVRMGESCFIYRIHLFLSA